MPIGQPDLDNSSIETRSQGGSRLTNGIQNRPSEEGLVAQGHWHILSLSQVSLKKEGRWLSPSAATYIRVTSLPQDLAFSDPGDKTINMAHALVNTVLISRGSGCGSIYFI